MSNQLEEDIVREMTNAAAIVGTAAKLGKCGPATMLATCVMILVADGASLDELIATVRSAHGQAASLAAAIRRHDA